MGGTTWPTRPDDAAYYGLAGEIVRTIEPHSEADPAALLIQMLVGYGNMIGRGAWQEVEADRHYGNLFVGIIGKTSKGRKGSSWGHVRRLLEGVEASWETRIASGLTSGEGLIWEVRDPDADEDEATSKAARDKRLLALETELAGTLRVIERQGNTLSPTLRDAWDRGNLRTLAKNSPARATGAHISVIGHTTAEELQRYLRATEMANGFGNRFLWLCVKRSKLLPDGGDMHRVDVAPLLERLREAVSFGKNAGELHRDHQARELWHRVYSTLSAERMGLLGAMTSRAEAQVVRLALLYALLDCSAAIRVGHLRAALALWGYCERSVVYIFGEALGDPGADDLLQALRAAGPDGMTRTAISNHYGRNVPSDEIDRRLGVLVAHGLAWSAPAKLDGPGRPAEVWYAGTKQTKETKESEATGDNSSSNSFLSSPSDSEDGYRGSSSARSPLSLRGNPENCSTVRGGVNCSGIPGVPTGHGELCLVCERRLTDACELRCEVCKAEGAPDEDPGQIAPATRGTLEATRDA